MGITTAPEWGPKLKKKSVEIRNTAALATWQTPLCTFEIYLDRHCGSRLMERRELRRSCSVSLRHD